MIQEENNQKEENVLENKPVGFDKEVIQKIIYAGFLLFLVLLPIPQFFEPGSIDTVIAQADILWMFGIYFLVAIVLELAVSKVFTGLKQVPLSWWCIAALLIAGLISLTQVDVKYMILALQGITMRSEGLYTLCGYYSIFFAACLLKKKKYRRNILLIFLAYSLFCAVMGILQYLGIWLIVEDAYHMACFPLQNPNIYASYATLFAGVSMAGFVYYREEDECTKPFPFWNRAIWFILALFSFAACLTALSSVVYVGIIMMFLMLLFIELVGKTKKFLPILLLFLGFVAVMFGLNALTTGGDIVTEFTSVGEQIAEEGSIFGESVGTDRMLIYKNSLKLLPKYWLLGCGIEQYFLAYLNEYGFWKGNPGVICDRAHNEYLNLWITEGLLAIVAYLVFLFALFIPSLVRAVKTSHKEGSDVFRNMMFLAFFGYIAQAFFNNSTVQVAPYFWMICGFLLKLKGREEE